MSDNKFQQLLMGILQQQGMGDVGGGFQMPTLGNPLGGQGGVKHDTPTLNPKDTSRGYTISEFPDAEVSQQNYDNASREGLSGLIMDILSKKGVAEPSQKSQQMENPYKAVSLRGNRGVDDMIKSVLGREGGFVNDVDDSGGATNLGITQKTLENYLGRKVSENEVKNLDEKTAIDIYKQEYFFGPKIDKLPEKVREQVFDIAVNSGPSTGIKLLQKVAGLKPDGRIGPETIRAAKTVNPDDLVEARIAFYENLANKRPKDRKFLKGWLNRAEEFRGI